MTEQPTSTSPSPDDLQQVEHLQQAYAKMKQEMGKIIVGQEQVVDELFMALFCRGHCLLIGVPGLAKTLMISTLSRILNLSFKRIQFTPDLMPSDITGTDLVQEDKATGERVFKFVKGPIFANVILADEINRTPPKTQAALLEAMQEYQVTAGGHRYDLDKPFFVLATQNPIEQEGTYPLPEAQLDRFMFMVKVDYPSLEEEREIVRRTTETREIEVAPSSTSDEILRLQEIVRRVPIADHVLDYALRSARNTRLTTEQRSGLRSRSGWPGAPDRARASSWSSPARHARCCRALPRRPPRTSARSPSRCCGTALITNFSAEAEGITTDTVVDRLLEEIDPNASAALADGKLPGVIGR